MEPVHTVTAADLADLLPKRKRDTHKGDYGYIALIGGCREYSGAPRLANLAQAALRCGCGVATLAVPRSLSAAVMPYLLESTLSCAPEQDGTMAFDVSYLESLTRGRRAIAVGMGWGRSEAHLRTLAWLLEQFRGTLIIDADGLWALAQLGVDRLRHAVCPIVLTPHCGEFARLIGKSVEEISQAPILTARTFAESCGAILLLKGSSTIVTNGSDTLLVDRGCPGMATAGSGDVLSGVLAGLLGYMEPTVRAVALGAYLCGLAGEFAARDVGETSMLASDTVSHLASAVRTVFEAKQT